MSLLQSAFSSGTLIFCHEDIRFVEPHLCSMSMNSMQLRAPKGEQSLLNVNVRSILILKICEVLMLESSSSTFLSTASEDTFRILSPAWSSGLEHRFSRKIHPVVVRNVTKFELMFELFRFDLFRFGFMRFWTCVPAGSIGHGG